MQADQESHPVDVASQTDATDYSSFLSRRMKMRNPEEGGSTVYTPNKIRADYANYCSEQNGFNPSADRPLTDLQRALVLLYETGDYDDFFQAIEWATARAVREWTLEDIHVAEWYIEESKRNPKLRQVADDDVAEISRVHERWRLERREL